MTVLLERAFRKAAALPNSAQIVLARELLREIEWERKWDRTLARSQDALEKLTRTAMREYRSGKTEEKGFDEL
ncbi:MAG: hypothetical protein NTW87_13175 [Planctomycetota bacterium]|nr:hypothetical protein [Planctomycetota bacterium]